MQSFGFIYYGPVFGVNVFVNDIRIIIPDHVFVGGDDHHVQVIDLFKFRCLGISGTGHTGQLVIHPEIILKSNGGQRLVFTFNFNIFLGFQRLVQTVAEPPARHGPTGEFINDQHFAVLDQVINIPLEKKVCFKGLVEMVKVFNVLRVIQVINLEKLFTQGNTFLGHRNCS